ncbi:gastrula zinc finger protein XlCGF52.1-like [Anopheles marshallii]|uniref:gastrula zinc finger protein XlCGF52.1-like n=1 Tax=Anopheles marshallii TaxID=1521116 RepID=UPI00237BA83F|nr:gastrula zinc finger protein XlCGF52.1-like [Anopheles marshallii]
MDIDSERLRLNFENVCRFCLSEENCLPLFIESTFNESLLDAADVLVLKVDENDGLPNCVCNECHRTMADFVQFEATALEAYNRLESLLTHLAEIGAYAGDDQQDDGEMLRDNDSPVIDGENIESETKHELDMGTNETHHPAHIEEIQTQSSKAMKKKTCPVCGKLVSQVSKHVQVHSGTKNFACDQCDKRFMHRSSLQKHLNIHRNIRNYRCEQCAQSFCDRSSLRYHLAKHRGVRRFQCEHCDRHFYTSTQWKQHQSLAHRERSFRCDQCGQMFLLKHHLMEHRQLHTDERSFECDVCGKTFKRGRYLIVHKRQHSKEV